MVLSLIALCLSMQYLQLIMLCNFYMCVLLDVTFSCNLHIAAGYFASTRHQAKHMSCSVEDFK